MMRSLSASAFVFALLVASVAVLAGSVLAMGGLSWSCASTEEAICRDFAAV